MSFSLDIHRHFSAKYLKTIMGFILSGLKVSCYHNIFFARRIFASDWFSTYL